MLYELNLNFKSIERKKVSGEISSPPGLNRVHMIQNNCTLWGECRCFFGVNTEAHVHPNPVQDFT